MSSRCRLCTADTATTFWLAFSASCSLCRMRDREEKIKVQAKVSGSRALGGLWLVQHRHQPRVQVLCCAEQLWAGRPRQKKAWRGRGCSP